LFWQKKCPKQQMQDHVDNYLDFRKTLNETLVEEGFENAIQDHLNPVAIVIYDKRFLLTYY
jgi:hypothetical protein